MLSYVSKLRILSSGVFYYSIVFTNVYSTARFQIYMYDKKAVLSQGERRDAAENFDTYIGFYNKSIMERLCTLK